MIQGTKIIVIQDSSKKDRQQLNTGGGNDTDNRGSLQGKVHTGACGLRDGIASDKEYRQLLWMIRQAMAGQVISTG